MPGAPLIPATLAHIDADAGAAGGIRRPGTAPARAREVFLNGNALPARWQGRSAFTILETGFGDGINFLSTWLAWRADPARPARLHYVAIEAHPFPAADLAQVHARWPELALVSDALREAWPPLVPGFHRLLLEQGRVVLTLAFGDPAHCLPQVDASIDAFYLDDIAPDNPPDAQTFGMLGRLDRLAAPGAMLAAHAAPDVLQEALQHAGFLCEVRAAAEGAMLSARFAPRRQLLPRSPVNPRSAIVIGAGLAGAAACERLAARGWQLTLIERRAQPAEEASGNLAGIVMPALSKDDNPTSRLTRAAYLFTLHVWLRLGGIGHAFPGEACGVLQLARNADNARVQRETAAVWQYPAAFAQWLEAAEAAKLLGGRPSTGGWLFPQGAWVDPAGVCRAMLAACGERINLHFECDAAMLERKDNVWQVHDACGKVIAAAPVVILANGAGATIYPQAKALPLTAIRGQVTHVPAAFLPKLPVVVCGEAYLTRPVQGRYCIGASYDADHDPQLRQSSQDDNLARLVRMLPTLAGAATMLGDAPLDGRVGFRCVSPDRLPLVGALPDERACATMSALSVNRLRDVPRLPGLYGLLGYASRGLTWAPFAAELLAARLEGEPLPVESELAAALDPARFMLKARRRADAA